MKTRTLACLAVVTAIFTVPGSCLGDDGETAAKTWMKYLQGKWAFENVENDNTGEFIVRKSAVDNVLLARAIDKDGKDFVAGVYVWDPEAKSLKMLAGFKIGGEEGTVSLSLDKFGEKEATGKQGDDSVGYRRVDENTWHVLGNEGNVTIKLKRQKAKGKKNKAK